MFGSLQPQPADKILKLMQMFKDDPREDKIDLGVGVYKNANGVTPIMNAVKDAEERIWQTQHSKAYVGLAGDAEFNEALIELVLADSVSRAHVAAVATPGGTGAVRQAFELVRQANPQVRLFVSQPTWPNHLSILNYLGIEIVEYRYFDEHSRSVNLQGMLDDIAQAGPNDVVLMHGCCHNPTGANLTSSEWDAVIASIQQTGATPMIDIAYQGFGDGLDNDAAATRRIASSCPEIIIAASCSKNFGIYRERTGQLMLITSSKKKSVLNLNQDTLAFLNRQNYSFPPDHGGRIVSTILNDDELRTRWADELEHMRISMLEIRAQLARELQQRSQSNRFGFIAQHRGMFSRLGCSPEKVDRLRDEHGIYMVGDSRINIAGLNSQTVPILAQAILDVGI
ncbi:MAG: aspartate/tyrosine/aromatic aminotransferase [Aestuariivita sp.]|nr:aspartate/tyrosine/aromatic aminotransferase [Aestuariivita sp.]